ncbi:MAG: M20/M25/M40 family metallo-hydrolase [Bryobacteraceae bacterium]
MKRIAIFVLCAALTPFASTAQTNPASLAARQWRQQHERGIVEEFTSLLAIPNIARDKEGIQKNAEALLAMMRQRGMTPRLVSIAGSNPVVFGEIRTPGATRTLVFYGHYDGQPLDPKEWTTPPFTPTLRDKRIEEDGQVIQLPPAGTPLNPETRVYARSASDDKATIIAMMTALDAIKAAGLRTKANIKFVFEGEEEAGSINLEKILAANKELFAGDLWLMCDGSVHQTRVQQIQFGARGVAGLDMTIYGPRIELHSGVYGNWAPNPAMLLVRLLATMKDDNGRVLIDHFYDEIVPLSTTEKQAISEAPATREQLMKEFWLGATEAEPQLLDDRLALPTLNIRGISSSRVGAAASNVIPSSATVSIDMRLVKGMDHAKTTQRFIEHVRKRGYFIVDTEPSPEIRTAHPKVARIALREGYNAARTSMDLPIAQEVIRTVESARGKVVKIPTLGGSMPLDAVERAVGTRTIVVPLGNHDNNQHSFNENLRVQNLWDGIELMAALLTM